jgi:hypothetical protein
MNYLGLFNITNLGEKLNLNAGKAKRDTKQELQIGDAGLL